MNKLIILLLLCTSIQLSGQSESKFDLIERLLQLNISDTDYQKAVDYSLRIFKEMNGQADEEFLELFSQKLRSNRFKDLFLEKTKSVYTDKFSEVTIQPPRLGVLRGEQ